MIMYTKQSTLVLSAMLIMSLWLMGVVSQVAAQQEPELLPPNAKPGECYARLFIPPVYKTETEQVLKKQASETLEIIPAQYKWVEERVLVKEASERLEIVPAEYEWVEEKVMVEPAMTKIEEIPAEYEWVEEKVLDKPAHTVWKKGAGPVQKINHSTGEIMCLVEVPATYKTIKKRLLKSPPKTHKVEIPAKYKTFKKQILKTPPTVKKVAIPAEYTTVKVKKLVSAAQEKRTPIPAEYQEVKKTKKVAEGRMEWRPILCQTNMTPVLITALQEALQRAGYNPGPIDGSVGFQTLTAVESFQREKGLASGGLTMETLKALGVQLHKVDVASAVQ